MFRGFPLGPARSRQFSGIFIPLRRDPLRC
jgi:hypothetical protein